MSAARRWLPLALVPAAAGLALAAHALLSVPAEVRDARGPGAAARAVGADDAIRLRRSLRLAAAAAAAPRGAVRLRGAAELALSREAPRHAQAATLLGTLTLLDAVADPANGARYTGEAANAFRTALRVDPRSEDAKYDLELLLTLQPRAAGRSTAEQARGKSHRRAGQGARSTAPKAGY